MKLLTKMLLINWHYIKYQVIDFSSINFLTGKNGAGKSTIIDALQLVLLGDTSGYYFNKAANDKSQRSLKGYLRGEVAEDENTNTIYLRHDDFSSYLVLEFLDKKTGQPFCLGIVFDCYADGSHDHQFFYLNAQLPDNNFINKGTELNRKGLKAFFYNNYPKGKYEFFETNSKYQDLLLGKFGQVNKKFFRLFKKAVPFSPIMDIKGFISEFVCDVENKIDITDMQENIRYYKQLEQDLEMVKSKISVMEAINNHFSSYQEEVQRLEVQNYLVDRAEEEKLQSQIIKLMQEVTNLREKVASIDLELKTKEEEVVLFNKQRDHLYAEKINSDIYKKRSELEEKIKGLEKEMEGITLVEKDLQGLVYSTFLTWREIDQWSGKHLKDMPSIEKDLRFLNDIYHGNYGLIDEIELSNLKKNLQLYLNEINDYYYALKREFDDLQSEVQTLKKQIVDLKQGIKPFPSSLQELKQLISQKLQEKHGKEIQPFIFADLLEIKGDKWRNAIEGYLNTQKFYLIIEPRYFLEALRIYDEFKFSNKLYDIGLVDIEKIIVKNPQIQKNSLAEEIETDNPYARAYANYLLGQVIKCENVEELRNYKIAITPTCMLYHNYVARQLNPRRYETPYIGRNAVAEQLRLKEQRLGELTSQSSYLETLVKKLAGLRNTSVLNDDNIKSMLNSKKQIVLMPQIKRELTKATKELGNLDLSYLTKIEDSINQVEKNIVLVNGQIRKLEGYKGQCIKEKESQEKSIPLLKDAIQEKQDEIASKYTNQWIEESGEPRFKQELKQRQAPQNIIDAFTTAVKRTQSIMERKWKTLLDARMSYNQEYGGAFDVQALNNGAYEKELKTLKDTFLVEYETKIKDAQEKAQIQFKEDFISKLKRNIDAAKGQIDDLNKALKDVPFGRDKYKFRVTPNIQYKKYYDMITDDLLLEGLTLFSGAFQDKYRDVIEELFRQIIDTEEGLLSADKREELNKNLEKYTDYRTYLDFDLVVTDDTGRESRLSRVINKKSGGETQTPFYISVLASFVQLYRIKQSQQNNTVRIIVFDEAYSKMDHQRIKESIGLIRRLGLQVILSAPTEKIGDIAPLVDRNLCVTRIKNETIIKAFDPRELEEMGA